MEKISTAYGKLGYLNIKVSSEIDEEDKLGDAKVEIEAGVICWIRADDREKFLKEVDGELNRIIDKYKI